MAQSSRQIFTTMDSRWGQKGKEGKKKKKYFGDVAKHSFADWRSHGKLLRCLSQKSKAHSSSFFCYGLGTIY